jgi:hypothetical protein
MSKLKPKVKAKSERLVAAALIRDGVVESRGFKSHWQIRAALGDADPTKNFNADPEGFLTSRGRFVTRAEACAIGVASGQLSAHWARPGRPLLSSDISW